MAFLAAAALDARDWVCVAISGASILALLVIWRRDVVEGRIYRRPGRGWKWVRFCEVPDGERFILNGETETMRKMAYASTAPDREAMNPNIPNAWGLDDESGEWTPHWVHPDVEVRIEPTVTPNRGVRK